MNDPEQLTVILTYSLMAIVILLFVLIIVFLIVWATNRKKNQTNEIAVSKNNTEKKTNNLGANKQSIHKFIEFDTVDDNMIIQDGGKRFLMVVECQGVNYDLMSGVEKTSVEEGFVQFLNSIRNPIQIYIQTRTVNLENSIENYKDRIRKIEEKLNIMKINYEQMQESGDYTQEQLEKAYFELTKQTNLYEYGRDIINNTERMSLNKNILNKKYYIIVPYYSAELGSNDLDKEETKNLVFSELYTRAQSIVASIAACGVRARIMRSNELVDLLYMAYNRDEAEVFSFEKAMKAGFDEIYSTAPDVLDKKMMEIDKEIKEKALEKAKQKLNEAITEKEREILDKEINLDELIDKYAILYLKENEKNVGKEITEIAKKKIKTEENKTKEGGKDNEEKSNKPRGRKPKDAKTE